MCDRSHLRAAKHRKVINPRSYGPDYDRMICLGCGIHVVEVGDYYMVNKSVWERLGLSWLDNLCIPCLERCCGHQFIGSVEVAPNLHRCADPDRALMAPHPDSIPGRRFRFSVLYVDRMMTLAA